MKHNWLVVLGIFFVPTCALAQFDRAATSIPTVTGNGSVVVKQMPTVMRMSIQFKESGKDLNAALKALKERRESAKSQLVKFGAKESSIHEGAAGLAGAAEEDPQMARMMARSGRPKKKKPAAKTTARTAVTGSLSCEWPLPATMEEILLVVQDVKDKVQSADLAGQKDPTKLSAEEQEEAEEMEVIQQQFGNSSEIKPGEPNYVFLARISDEARQKARAEAYRKARLEAEQLATAAGQKIGPLHSLGSPFTQFTTSGRHRYMNDDQFDEQGDETNDEWIGKSPACAMFRFTLQVQAAFQISE